MDRVGWFLWLLLFHISISVSGLPTSSKARCKPSLLTTIGDHYDLSRDCDDLSGLDEEREALREKYYKKVLELQNDNPDLKLTSDIVEGLMNFIPPITLDWESTIKCTGCETAVNTVRLLKTFGTSNKGILNFVKGACSDFKIMTPEVCDGIIEQYGTVFLAVVEKSKEKSDVICSYVYNANCGYESKPWNVTFPPNKKPPVASNFSLSKSVRNLKVLHITDTHWDPDYVEGTWSECELPLCCRKENVLPEKGGSKAGKYGGWKCDVPEITFDEMLKDVAARYPKLDYILWTGDLPAHDIWNQTATGNLNILKKTAAKIKAAFPKTPVYPSLGNHESVPPNMFPFEQMENNESPMKWLYEELSVQWKPWLAPEEINNVKYGAYYTMLIRPGFRIVSLNMNFCYSFNWWLVLDSNDPLSQLQWLISVLQRAEDNKESVHIIGHIPPGNHDCLKMWQTNYYRIINRYENTVTAQFFGHTHNDKFELYYDEKDPERAFGVGYVAPSLTTYTYLNPTYRIYEIQGDASDSRRFVVDHETWYLDLEKANAENRAEWKKLYSAKEKYNMSSLHPKEWDKVYRRIALDNNTLQLYDEYSWCGSPKRPPCDKKCRKLHLCDIRSCAQYGAPNIKLGDEDTI